MLQPGRAVKLNIDTARFERERQVDLVIVESTTHVLASHTLHKHHFLVGLHNLYNLWGPTGNLLFTAGPACSTWLVSPCWWWNYSFYTGMHYVGKCQKPYLHRKMTCTLTAPIEPSLNPPGPLSAIPAAHTKSADRKQVSTPAVTRPYSSRAHGTPESGGTGRLRCAVVIC